ncbi:hypothetical protein KM043_009731 [Ampulex compressa]|nr:hypothetical protein KM043_009731 [Ampulex compressa]
MDNRKEDARSKASIELGALLDLKPLHIVVETEPRQTTLRPKGDISWRESKKDHSSIVCREGLASHTLEAESDRRTPLYRFRTKYKTRLTSKAEWEQGRRFLQSEGPVWNSVRSEIAQSMPAWECTDAIEQ